MNGMEGNGMDEQRQNEVLTIISNRMLRAVYQPIVSLTDGSVFAFEALSVSLVRMLLSIYRSFLKLQDRWDICGSWKKYAEPMP